jgi:phospholipase A1
MTKSLRVYAQYWNGYGESLLDYDARIQRIGIGVSLNDYIQR